MSYQNIEVADADDDNNDNDDDNNNDVGDLVKLIID